MRYLPMACGLAFLVAACGAEKAKDLNQEPTPLPTDERVPDFGLVDTNSTSPTSGQSVSPRDLMEKVSGWYFTHAS